MYFCEMHFFEMHYIDLNIMEGFCPIKEIDLNREVLTLKLLKDKRLAAGNNFGKLNIYNLDNYQHDIIIEG